MGAEEYSGGNGQFFTIKHFAIVRESKTEREGFTATQVTNPETKVESTKWIKKYKSLVGYITKIEWRTSEFQGRKFSSWRLHLKDGEWVGILDLAWGSPACDRFMNMAENLDPRKPVEIRAWKDTQSDPPKVAFIICQGHDADGKAISVTQRYTRQNPGERPAPRQLFGGKWDFSTQKDWLASRVVEYVIPKFAAASAMQPQEPVGQGGDYDPADDMPTGRDYGEPPFDASEPADVDDSDEGIPF